MSCHWLSAWRLAASLSQQDCLSQYFLTWLFLMSELWFLKLPYRRIFLCELWSLLMVFLLSGCVVGVVVTLLVKMIADQQGLQPFCFLSFNFERPRAGLKTLKWRKLDQDRLAGSFNEETWSGHTDHTRGKHNQGDFTPNLLQLLGQSRPSAGKA